MESKFTPDFFRNNREKLRTLFTGTAPIVLTANGLLQRNGENNFPFRQDSSFWYLTGINNQDIVLVMDKGKEFLISSVDRDAAKIAFDGAVDNELMAKVSGIETVYDNKTGWKKLESRLKRVQHVATLGAAPAYIEWHDLYSNPARANLISRIKEITPDVDVLDLRPHLARMRAIKQPAELEALQQAIDITIDSMQKVTRRLSKYSYEYEIEADLTHGYRSRGAMGHSFSPIVASGKNTCMLHYFANDQPLENKSMMYIDTGAEFENYAADLTRTYFLKEPAKREKKIFDAVIEVYEFAREILKPGVRLRENEVQVEQFMGEKLRELGLIKSIEKEEVRKFFPHATSHSLGLDPHDAIDYERPVEAGMVLTIEPGIYIPEEGIGVRIEDDFLVTEDGVKNLSSRLPVVLE
jgi:Xaa-Pro aminopeptidase